MRRLFASGLIVLALMAAARLAFPAGPVAKITLDHQVQLAMSPDPATAARARERLRQAGPKGLEAVATYRDVAARTVARSPKRTVADQKVVATIDALMDDVGGAKYCSRSRLYWHTDFDAARRAAEQSGKPILSLRMLGNLSDDYSCANSRFFRTTLYSNAEISQYLRDNFVLHWRSVRPVPVVTIDFGDGRVLKRTITGNSIHYVLTSDGRVVDALPGVYGPSAFRQHLDVAMSAAREMNGLDGEAWSESLARYHTTRLEQLEQAWQQDLARIASPQQNASPPQLSASAISATAAMQLARPKMRVEMPILRKTMPIVSPDELSDDKQWQALAALRAEEAQLDNASIATIRSENPTALQVMRLAVTKAVVEDPLARIVRTLQNNIALDTVRNEYQLHRKLHQWLTDANYRPAVDDLNERVYAELFLTPSTDPWLGLAPSDVYTALPDAGIVTKK
jgi:hypothetical protein